MVPHGDKSCKYQMHHFMQNSDHILGMKLYTVSEQPPDWMEGERKKIRIMYY